MQVILAMLVPCGIDDGCGGGAASGGGDKIAGMLLFIMVK